MPKSQLTAETLKESLWETLQAIKSGKMQAQDAHAISSQAREIMKTVNLQFRVNTINGRDAGGSVKKFAGDNK